MTQNATGFLAALGKDDAQDDVPRRRKDPKGKPGNEQPPATVPEVPPTVEAPPPFVPEQPERVFTPARSPEPNHKISVDLPWSLKLALQELVERDKRGPKAELVDALRAHLTARGIEIKQWKG